MKDLRSRWNAMFVLFSLVMVMGCLVVPVHARTQSPSGLVIGDSTPNFGTVIVGDSTTVTDTLMNATSSAVTISQAQVVGSDFTITAPTFPMTLAAGQQTTLAISFAPTAPGLPTATVYISSNAPNSPVTLQLSAIAVILGQLATSPASFSFGNVTVGSSQTVTGAFFNTGGTNLTISQASISGSGFQLSGLNLPVTLQPNQSTPFNVTFTPSSNGPASGNIAVTSKVADWANNRRGQYVRSHSKTSSQTTLIQISGTGAAPATLTAASASLSFGSVQTGKSQTLTETLTNTGGSSVTVTQAPLIGSGYSVTGLTLPLTLSANQSANFSVVFAPQSSGNASGNLSIISNVSTLAIPLSGSGVTPGALSASPSSINFGNVQTGKSVTLAETITNTGGSSVTVTQAPLTGSGYSLTGLTLPLTLLANQSATFSVIFAPQSSGNASGSLSIIGDVATVGVVLSGAGATPAILTSNPSSIVFGNVQVGNVSTQFETLTNTGGSNLTISQASLSAAGFSTTGLNLPLTLTPEQSVSFSVTYTPLSASSTTGSLSIVSDSSNPNVGVSLSGTGTASGQLSVTPTSDNFGNVVVGTAQSTMATLTAAGSSVIVSGASVSTSEFSLSGLSFPFTLAAGQSTSFSITFTPQASGTATATASFASNAANSPAVAALTGTGSAPPQHQVDLSWNPSNSGGVVGYNVYRGAKTGGPYSKINPVLDASNAYSDSSVTAGQSYYYVTTAVDTSGMESSYSNEVPATVPTP